MNDTPSNAALPPDEEFVAYLDGELDAESSRRVEELLTRSNDARRRLQAMERTWDLLDDLDTVPVDSRFTQSTLEMVAVAAGKDVEQSLAEAPRRRRRRAMAVVGSLAAATALGFLAVFAFWPDPNRMLLQHLPLLENLDQYRQVEDIEFLGELRNGGLFTVDGDESPAVLSPPPEEPLDRRERIEHMSPGDKERLLRQQKRFLALSADEQKRLRGLHDALQEAPDARQLRQLMYRYCEWLKTLPAFTRAELADIRQPSDRVQAVQRQLREQSREAGRRLAGKDAEKLTTWMNQCAAEHTAEFLQTLSPEQRERLEKFGPQMRRSVMIREIWRPWQQASAGKPPSMMNDDDLSRLRGELSPQSQKALEGKSMAEQWRVVANWLRHAGRQRPARGLSSDSDEERLAQFFEKLDGEELDRLLALPAEDMQRTLQQLYFMRTRSREGGGRRGDGPPRRSDSVLP